MIDKDFLTINEFASEIRVHPNTVRKMIKNKRLAFFRVGGGKTSSYRIAKSEINRLALVELESYIDSKVKEKFNEKNNKC